MGILPDVANDLHVFLSSAGLLVTGYALGVAIGGPVITACTGRLSPRARGTGIRQLSVVPEN